MEGENEMTKSLKSRCIKKAIANRVNILRIPEIVAGVHHYLRTFKGYGGEKKLFTEIQGQLVFWIDTVERKDMLKSVLIEVIVKLSRHNPSVLRFQTLGGRTIYQLDLQKFEENLHMEGEDIGEIRVLWNKRITGLSAVSRS